MTRTRALYATTLAAIALAAPANLMPPAVAASRAGLTEVIASAGPADAATRASLAAGFGRLPTYFIENRGQKDARAAYYVQGAATNVYFTKSGIVYDLAGPPEGERSARRMSRRHALRLGFERANPEVVVAGEDPTEAVVSYFKGPRESWRTGATFRRVVYRELWPGIDLEFTGGEEGTLKYTYVVHPGADPRLIRLSYAGASGVRRTAEGRLEVQTSVGDLVEDRPYVYQERDGQRVEVESDYEPLGPIAPGEPDRVGYRIGRYDPTRPLYVDPAVLRYCGFIGGAGYDAVKGIAVDASGYAYVIGETNSTAASFPETVGAYNTSANGLVDIFVAKIKPVPNGGTPESNLVYCTYLGGSGAEDAGGIAIDGAGNAYVFGDTWSNVDFPKTVGPDITFNGGSSDAFVTKINAAGTALVYSGFIGGSGQEWAGAADLPAGIAVDAAGAAYVLGATDSTNVATVVGPDLTWNGGLRDAFVAKVKADGSGFDYLGYLGGSGADDGYALALDSAGNAYVGGFTDNPGGFPATVGPDLSHNGGLDGFVCKIKPVPNNATPTNNYDYCGFVGGLGYDRVMALAVVPSGPTQGTVIIGGYTDSLEGTFPEKLGPDITQNDAAVFVDGFVAKLLPVPNNATPENNYAWCGYIGGSANDIVRGVAIDELENVYVAGYTESSETSFPVAVGPDLTYNGTGDAFVAKLELLPNDPTPANNYLYNGYIGGVLTERAFALAVRSYDAYVAGDTQSSHAQGFPFTVGPDLIFNGGSSDGFVAKVGGGSGCCQLGTSADATTVTVTGAGQFEMRFNTATGGGIDELYDLVENPTKTNDLAGGVGDEEALLGLWVEYSGTYYTTNGGPGSKLDVLEATPTRVRVRGDSFFEADGGTTILPGMKGVGDYSVYGIGRTAVRFTDLNSDPNPRAYDSRIIDTNGHWTGGLPLSSYTRCYQGNAACGAGAGSTGQEDWVLGLRDVAGARTDFLFVLSQDWAQANSIAYFSDNGAPQYSSQSWTETANLNIPASQTWNLLTYFKPTSLGAGASPWLDTAVTSRSADYRTPSAVTVGPGTQWQDAVESTGTGGDFFNESEAAYVFNLNPATGLTFTLDGSGTTRYSPFFKLREWRSFVEAPSVTFDADGPGATPAITLRKGVHYEAAVKPVTAAHFANTLTWHCTIDDNSQTNTCTGIGIPDLDVGSSGGVSYSGCPFAANCVEIVPARYGTGANFNDNSDSLSAASGVADFSVGGGAVEFWYQPNQAHTASGPLVFWRTNTADDCFVFEKTGANALRFTIKSGASSNCTTGGSSYQVSVPSGSYSWRAKDWVHLRTTWSNSGGGRMAIWMNGVELAFNTGYSSVGVTNGASLVFGGCSGLGCPLNSTGNADGIIDEPAIYFGPSEPVSIAHAGLVGAADEYLADSTFNYPLNLARVDGSRRGRYLYFGSDAKFHGLNVSLAAAGGSVADNDLAWQYWRAASGGWVTMAPTDGTKSLKQTGTVSWTDPIGWTQMSINGGPDLYYIRAHLPVTATADYGPIPIERQIKTDILLFQYCGDVTTAAATFAFAPPPTTEVKLQSFTATPGDSSVLVEWRTASELSNQGFHIYRALSESGPWTRLTASLIPGLGSSAVGQAYSFRDIGLANGTRYFYRLEDVDASSKATPHGPVSAVPATGAPGGAPGSEPPTGGAKKKGASSALCPDWVVAAYGSLAGASTSSATLRCTRHGDPEAVSLGVVSRDSRQATLELKTGGFYALHEPSGRVRVFVPGFDFPQDPQAPALPFRRALVDAVVGRRAQLGGVRALDQVSFKGLVPASLGKAEMQVSRDGTVRAGRRAARESAPQHVPLDLARLLPSVFQGETKSAVVQITPLRYDARRQQIVLSKRVLVKLLFTGRETGESGRGRVGRRERPQKPVTGELLARLYTTGRGLYAVSFEQLLPGRLAGLASSQLRLERQGQAQGFHVAPAAEAFGPGSVLYFHADTAASSTDFSSETAWELVRARDGLPMPLVLAAASSGAVTSASTRRVSFETNRFYQPGLLEAQDLWLWEALASGTTRAKSFSLSGVDSASSQAAGLEVFLQGASESGNPVDHHVSVSLNGTPVGEAQFAGKKPYRMSLSVPHSLLREGANELQLTNVADTGVSSFVFLDRFTLAHAQASLLSGGRFEGEWPESGSVSLSGVSGALAVVDVTGPGAARWLTGSTASGGTLRFQVEAGHRYLAVSQEALLTPRVAAPAPSSLRATQNQADYLLIAPRAFLAAAEPLLQRRRDQGLATRAVAFEEISDEFGHGQPSAQAIKGFLSFAFQSWTRPSPRYALLLGDSTYDPRNFVGTSQASPLPALWAKTSYLWTASDPELAAVNGEDALPDLAIGRLPATTVEQAQLLVDKLIAWEDSGQALSGPALLVADNPDLAGDFEADARDIAASFLPGRSQLLLLSQLGAGTRPAIQDAMNSGLSLLSYVGHGGAAVWASENVWNSWDAPSLQAQSRQPFLLTMNCLNGYFVAPAFDSLAESLLKAEGRGAIAAFSPSGLSLDGPAHHYHRALMAELTNGQHARLGDAVLAAQEAYTQTGLMPELLSVYHLLGDPAMRIR